ncbi:MAG: 6-bladed beta-propeller [Candidatus Aminicenantes bacterium]|jgi:hypothetical protein
MRKIIPIAMLLLVCFPSAFGNEAIIIGNVEGEGMLIYPSQVEEGPDGNIYVYDMADSTIKVYSPDGKYLRRIGGQGQGPGEIQRADGVTFGFTEERNLFYSEYFGGHPWITLVDLSGEFLKVKKIGIKERFGVDRAVSLPGDRFLIQFSFVGRPEKKKDYFLQRFPEELMTLDAEGKILSRIIRKSHYSRISYYDQGADLGIPFIPVFVWSPFKNETVIFSDGLSTKLKVIDYDGKVVREIETPLPEPEKVTKKDLARWKEWRKESFRDKTWYNRFGRVIEKYKKSIYEKRPNLSGIALTPEGNILVSGRWSEDEQNIKYWLLDEEGNSLAQITTEARNLRISKHYIFYGTTDEEENILAHCLKRGRSEKEDLLRISRR